MKREISGWKLIFDTSFYKTLQMKTLDIIISQILDIDQKFNPNKIKGIIITYTIFVAFEFWFTAKENCNI